MITLGQWLRPASALAADLRATILKPVDSALLERVEGQTSDLEWRLELAAGPAELARAVELAGASRVDAVIWFEPTRDNGFRVCVFDPAGQRQLERVVSPPAEEELASSTTAELAALIVRSALQAIAAGRSIGERVETPPPAPARPVKGSAQHTGSQVSKRAAVAELGGMVVTDGPSRLLEPGIWLGIGMEWPRFSAGIFGSTTGKSDTALDRATIRLQRQQLGVMGALRLLDSRPIGVSLRLGLGVLAYRRETLAVNEGLTPTPPAVTLSLCAGPEIAVTWLPLRANWLSLLVVAGLDLAPSAPTIAYQVSSQTLDDSTLYRVQPRILAGIQLRQPMP